MAIFGENLTTVELEDWQRHRKLTAPSFNEKSSKYVWEEAARQALGMLNLRITNDALPTNRLEEDCRDIALHVLCYAGFNIRYDFGKGVCIVPDGHTMSLRDCLFRVVREMVLLYIIPMKFLTMSWAPKEWRQTGHAVVEFTKYMQDAVQHERLLQAQENYEGRDTFYGALIRASSSNQADLDNVTTTKTRRTGLSDEEVYGNIYIFNTAGHDTTANTMLFALALLALQPQWQDWISEELNFHNINRHVDDYERIYPKLLRCQALMLETTRLYGPVCYIPKSTPSHDVVNLQIAHGELQLPKNTGVFINVKYLATDADVWGTDARSFRPSRWIENESITQGPQGEVLRQPPHRGAFLAWGTGARNCPGRKFSQVEFVAAIAVLLSQARVEPSLSPRSEREMEALGTSQAQMKEAANLHLAEVLGDVSLKFTVALNRPEELYIRWRRL